MNNDIPADVVRLEALRLACGGPPEPPDAMVKRAEMYFAFLSGTTIAQEEKIA